MPLHENLCQPRRREQHRRGRYSLRTHWKGLESGQSHSQKQWKQANWIPWPVLEPGMAAARTLA